MTLRTDDDLDAALAELARAEGISKQEAARRAILEKHQALARRDRIEVVADNMLERWGDVLDRLGKA